jgi:hypothetical protein
MPGVLLTAQVPLLVAITAAVFFWSLKRGAERVPFLLALALFLLGLHLSLRRSTSSDDLGRRLTA